MPDETPQPESLSPPEEKPKRKLPEAMIRAQWKPGQSGNPLGRLPSTGKRTMSPKILQKLTQIWLRADAQDEWFKGGLEFMQKQGLSIAELITARKLYCLATNTRYNNAAVLKDLEDRTGGKPPLYVGQKIGEQDDYEELTDEELQAYITERMARVQMAAEEPPLPEGSPPDE